MHIEKLILINISYVYFLVLTVFYFVERNIIVGDGIFCCTKSWHVQPYWSNFGLAWSHLPTLRWGLTWAMKVNWAQDCRHLFTFRWLRTCGLLRQRVLFLGPSLAGQFILVGRVGSRDCNLPKLSVMWGFLQIIFIRHPIQGVPCRRANASSTLKELFSFPEQEDRWKLLSVIWRKIWWSFSTMHSKLSYGVSKLQAITLCTII